MDECVTLMVLNNLTQPFGTRDGKRVESVAHEHQKVLLSIAHFSAPCSYAHLVFACLVVVFRLLMSNSTPWATLRQWCINLQPY